MGVVQGLFLSIVLFVKSGKNLAITFLGWSLFFQSLVFLDVYLCYTGLMKYVLVLNDSTEGFVLLIAPTFYLFTRYALKRKPLGFKERLIHFTLPVFYILTQIPFYTAPVAIKLNAYLGAFHSQIEMATTPPNFNFSYHWIKDHFDWLVLISFLFYGFLGLKLVWDERKRIRKIPYQANFNKYLFTRNSVIILFITFSLIFLVFSQYEDDGGDHYIAIAQTMIIFITSYVLLTNSKFFEKSWFSDKYETINNDSITFEEVENYLATTTYYLSDKISLKALAEKLDTSTNSLSKTINSELGLNFNDYVNQKRVKMAKKRLLNEDFAHLTVEAIGNSVGFNSKSAFYNAFKKQTKTSPSAFLKQEKAK